MLVQVEQQHLFAFEHALGEGTSFIHLRSGRGRDGWRQDNAWNRC